MNMNKVLFIDDEKYILKMIQRKLDNTDIEGFYASDGYTGLSLMESEDISVIFTDLMMPKINGLHLAEEIYKRNPKAVIVVLSGNSNAGTITKTMNSHYVYKYLFKPWKLDSNGIGFIRECLNVARQRMQGGADLSPTEMFVDVSILQHIRGTKWVLVDKDMHVMMTGKDYEVGSYDLSVMKGSVFETNKGIVKLYQI